MPKNDSTALIPFSQDGSQPLDDPQQERVATYMAKHRSLRTTKVAATCGVLDSEVRFWRGQEPFRNRLAALRDEYHLFLAEQGVANKKTRIADLQSLLKRHWSVVRARELHNADDARFNSVPEGQSGFYFINRFDEIVFDRPLHDAIMEVSLRAAKEMGQWSEKTEVTQEHILREYRGVDLDKLLAS